MPTVHFIFKTSRVDIGSHIPALEEEFEDWVRGDPAFDKIPLGKITDFQMVVYDGDDA